MDAGVVRVSDDSDKAVDVEFVEGGIEHGLEVCASLLDDRIAWGEGVDSYDEICLSTTSCMESREV